MWIRITQYTLHAFTGKYIYCSKYSPNSHKSRMVVDPCLPLLRSLYPGLGPGPLLIRQASKALTGFSTLEMTGFCTQGDDRSFGKPFPFLKYWWCQVHLFGRDWLQEPPRQPTTPGPKDGRRDKCCIFLFLWLVAGNFKNSGNVFLRTSVESLPVSGSFLLCTHHNSLHGTFYLSNWNMWVVSMPGPGSRVTYSSPTGVLLPHLLYSQLKRGRKKARRALYTFALDSRGQGAKSQYSIINSKHQIKAFSGNAHKAALWKK